MATKEFNLAIFINKNPIEPAFQPVHGTADFSALDIPPKKNTLYWDKNKLKLYILVSQDFFKELWHATGKIASVVDLKGSQIEFVPPMHHLLDNRSSTDQVN